VLIFVAIMPINKSRNVSNRVPDALSSHLRTMILKAKVTAPTPATQATPATVTTATVTTAPTATAVLASASSP